MNSDNPSPLIRLVDKLALHAPISPADRIALLELPYTTRFIEAGSYLLRDGDKPDRCGMLISGFASRHKTNADGLRQIVSLLIAGEIYDLQQLYLAIADSNVQALTSCHVATISHQPLRKLVADRPAIGHAFVAAIIVELSMSREWTLNVGRRDARKRTAHFLCEIAFRLDKLGSPHGQPYDLPMTQEQLGDALGLTAVHVNRTIKALVDNGLISHNRRGVTILNWELLVRESGFSSRYLHMKSPESTQLDC